MPTDRYTRVVLTVIALCLIWICLRETAPPAFAQSGPADVRIVGVSSLISGSLPVHRTDD